MRVSNRSNCRRLMGILLRRMKESKVIETKIEKLVFLRENEGLFDLFI